MVTTAAATILTAMPNFSALIIYLLIGIYVLGTAVTSNVFTAMSDPSTLLLFYLLSDREKIN